MLCFELFVNGKKRCTAGVHEFGVLSASIMWANRFHEEGTVTGESHNGSIQLSGYEDITPWKGENVVWFHDERNLQQGDEILIRVIETDVSDPPVQRGWPHGPEAELKAKEARRKHYERLKREFEGD